MRNSDILLEIAKKGALLSIPFILYFISVFLIDPYTFFGKSGLVDENLKEEYASRINTPLYLLLRYRDNPATNLLLGDSRMGLIRKVSAERLTGKKFFNLSFGASTLPEVLDACRMATATQKPDAIYIGISLELYNLYNSRNRVTGVEAIIGNPLLYLSNINVLESSYLIIKAEFTGTRKPIEKPAMSRGEFWQYQLKTTGARYFSRYAYPAAWYNELKELSEWCNTNKVRLVFVILPTHVSLQQQIATHGLTTAENRFLTDMRGLAEVFDFNFSSPLTADSSLFDDPFHVKKEVADSIATLLFTTHDADRIDRHEWFQHTYPR